MSYFKRAHTVYFVHSSILVIKQVIFHSTLDIGADFCGFILCRDLFLRIRQVIFYWFFFFWFWGIFLCLSYSVRDVDSCSPSTSHWCRQVGEQTQKLHAWQVQDHGTNAFIFHLGSGWNKVRRNVHRTRKSGGDSKEEKYNSIL